MTSSGRDASHPSWAGSPGGAPLLAIAFVAETALLAGLFWVGWSIGSGAVVPWVLGFLLAGTAAAVWGRWCAPRSGTRVPNPARAVLKSALFVATFVLLVVFTPRPQGAVFGLGTLLLFAVSLPADRDPVGAP